MPQKNIIKEYEPHSYYHIYNHAVAEQPLIFSDKDAKYFVRLFDIYLSKYQVTNEYGYTYKNYSKRLELMAYCLMPNHFHLLVYQYDSSAIEEFIGSICTAYSMYFNKSRSRRGRVFESTYKAVRITDETYLQYISKYIHKNPESLIENINSFKWSSYQYYSDKRSESPEWLATKRLLGLFDNNRAEYNKFIFSR